MEHYHGDLRLCRWNKGRCPNYPTEISFSRVGVRMSWPLKMADLRLHDLDDSITADDILSAVTGSRGCVLEEVKIVAMQMTSNDLGTLAAMSFVGGK